MTDLGENAESALATALTPDSPPPCGTAEQLGTPAAFEFQEFGFREGAGERSSGLDTPADVEVDLRIELGRIELPIEDVDKLRAGSVVPLDKLAGDPVDVLVDGRLVARGEVLVLNDNFCVRVAEILTPDS